LVIKVGFFNKINNSLIVVALKAPCCDDYRR